MRSSLSLQPATVNLSYLRKLKPVLAPHCLLTDVGSVKGDIARAVKDLGLEKQFIGGHPMAGSEAIGYEHSSEYLLENAYYILTPERGCRRKPSGTSINW